MQLSCPQGERGAKLCLEGCLRPPVSFIHSHELIPPPLKPVASLSRQPPPSRSTFSGAQTDPSPAEGLGARRVRGWVDAACLRRPSRAFLPSGAWPRKRRFPSQAPASLSKSHRSWLGGERPNLPPRPLHPLPIQNQFIWVIFKARRWGQLEPVASSRPNASSFFQPRADVLWVPGEPKTQPGREWGPGSPRRPAAAPVGSKQKAWALSVAPWPGDKGPWDPSALKALEDWGIRSWPRLPGCQGQMCVPAQKEDDFHGATDPLYLLWPLPALGWPECHWAGPGGTLWLYSRN